MLPKKWNAAAKETFGKCRSQIVVTQKHFVIRNVSFYSAACPWGTKIYLDIWLQVWAHSLGQLLIRFREQSCWWDLPFSKRNSLDETADSTNTWVHMSEISALLAGGLYCKVSSKLVYLMMNLVLLPSQSRGSTF